MARFSCTRGPVMRGDGSARAAPPQAPIAANVAAARGAAEMYRMALSFLDEIAMNANESDASRLAMRSLWPRFGGAAAKGRSMCGWMRASAERGARVTLSGRIN